MSEQEQDATGDDWAEEQRSARMRAAIREIPTDLPMSDITEAIEAAVGDRARLVAEARERALVSQVNMYQADSLTAQAEHARWQERAEAAEAAQESLEGDANDLRIRLARMRDRLHVWRGRAVFAEAKLAQVEPMLQRVERMLRGLASAALEQTPEPPAHDEHCGGCGRCDEVLMDLDPVGKYLPEPLTLDPEPWLCHFGCRSSARESHHFRTFKPRKRYEQDRAHYEGNTDV